MYTKAQLHAEACVLVSIKRKILAARKVFKETGEYNRAFNNNGLCSARGYICTQLFNETMDKWPKHSGARNYPVSVGTSPASIQYFDTNNILGVTSSTPYTRKRMELLNWMITDLQTQVKNYG